MKAFTRFFVDRWQFTLILFIMPCLFIVLVGPSVVTLTERFGG